MSAVAHFIQGQSAAGSLRQAYRDARIAYVSDHFTDGRCRFEGATSMDAWLAARHDWWVREEGAESLAAMWSAPEAIEQLCSALDGVEEVVLWLADGATERVHACWLAAYLPEAVRISVAQPANRWAHRTVQTIGIVRSEVLAATATRAMDDSERAALADAWHAFVEPSPVRFFQLADSARTESLLFGLSDLKFRFPERRNGLTLWERRLLRSLADNRGRPSTYSFASLIFTDDRDSPHEEFLDDIIWEWEEEGLLEELPEGAPELSPHYEHPSLGEIQASSERVYFGVTELGSAILAGERNRVDAVGFDRWFGGTHLNRARDAMWWRDGDSIVGG